MVKINLIELSGCPIYKQLQLEEALLRGDAENYCLLNFGSSEESIVLGISSKVEELVNLDRLKEFKIPLIRRFSGGGTVIVDQNTLFVTFIFNEKALDVVPFPEPILRWGEQFYQCIFQDPDFALHENDFVFKEKKFGGNAQYIRKERWLLHTSFLWDYAPEKMDLLKNPKKAPYYRNGRSHEEFLTTLKRRYLNPQEILTQIKKGLYTQFQIEKVYTEYPAPFLKGEHRKTTQLIDYS